MQQQTRAGMVALRAIRAGHAIDGQRLEVLARAGLVGRRGSGKRRKVWLTETAEQLLAEAEAEA